jgi:anaerobic magnesium-protoporphyrin IX monomethyl ester cyclase
MADILLVYPAPGEFKERRFGFSLDLLYIASLLKQAGHSIVNYLDYSIEPFDREKFYINADKAEVVILEFDSFPLKRAINIQHGEKLIQDMIKRYGSGAKRTKKIILFGNDIALIKSFCEGSRGPHGMGDLLKFAPFFNSFSNSSPAPANCTCHLWQKRAPLAAGGKELEFDCALATGFENNINTVVDCLLKGRTLPELHPLDDLDRLPYPDRNLLTSYAQHGGTVDSEPKLAKSTLLRTSSGCLNSCVFCQRKGWHKKYMAHSTPYVIKEFSLLKNNNYRNIWICDDNFTYDLKRSRHLLKALVRQQLTINMKLALSSWTRIDEEFLELAGRANVSIISFGIESANREIQEFYRKPINLESFHDLVSFADSTGLYSVGNFIIGAPMETEDSIGETFDYIMNTPFDQVNIKILDYMAGSELYERLPPEKRGTDRHIFACKENGLNDFPLEVLKTKIKHFLEQFRKSREKHLKEKMKQYGPPYDLLKM